MMQTALSSMLAIMMVKFLLNDLPHAVGLTSVQPSSRKSVPSTFGVVDREQRAYEFLLPYLQSESKDIEFAVDIFLVDADDYPGLTYGIYVPSKVGYILIYIHIRPVVGEVIDSLGALAHEIGHHRTTGVVNDEDKEAQAKSVGKYLMRKWLVR